MFSTPDGYEVTFDGRVKGDKIVDTPKKKSVITVSKKGEKSQCF